MIYFTVLNINLYTFIQLTNLILIIQSMRRIQILKSLLPALMLVIATCQACREKEDDDVKIHDIMSLQSQFANPPAEYTTSPFFVWDADITSGEIDRFLTDFKNAGSSQVFVHPRPGLVTEYLSDKWFELFRHTVQKGKELGMKIWIYDENSYPSGFGGGNVPAGMPESYNQGQGLQLVKADMLPDTAGKFLVVLKEETGGCRDITNELSSFKGAGGRFFLFYKTYNEKSDWYGGFSYVDLLYPGVTQKFINVTMTGYEKVAGDEFGKTVPGTFTDEPQITSPGGIRFTPDIFNKFRDKWGYDLRPNLPSLFEETGDWKRVRHNYTQVLLDLFIERWSKPWNEYCESKNLKFTGHYWEHEWPSMQPGGDNMAMYIYHQEPAIDMLFDQYNDSLVGAQFGNVRSVKELASAANQAGRNRKLSETYGGSGWDLTFRNMKRNGDWEFALGINQMNQHLTFFSMEGARKYDYPPTFDYHEPWWQDYKFLNDHYARLSLALSSGRQRNDILVIEPTTSSWMYDSYVKSNKHVREIGQSFQSFVTMLEKNQVEYDLGSEKILSEKGSTKSGKLNAGDASYSRVVIPPLTENLNSNTFSLIKKFVSDGGTLIALSSPSLIDGKPDTRAEKFFRTGSAHIILIDDGDNRKLLSYLDNKDTRFYGVKGGVLYHHTRKLNDGRVIFLVNSSLTDSVRGSLKTAGTGATEMNTFTGALSGYACTRDGNNIGLEFEIPPAGSLLLCIPSSGSADLPTGSKPAGWTKIMPSNELSVKNDSLNALTIDFCDLTLGSETWKDLYFWEAADKVFRHFGFKNGDPWNTSVQYKRNIVDRDTFGVKSGFTVAYHFTVSEKAVREVMKAVIERPSLWKVTMNGNELKPEAGKWWLDRSFGVFNIGNYVKQGENTIMLSASPMSIHSEVETIYILGDFAVETAARGWKIAEKGKKTGTGSWKVQGMPFYSWGVNYSREYNIPSAGGSYMVRLNDWNGTVAEVYVNGDKAGIIGFPPYAADVTKFVKAGKNLVTVKIIGSLRNLEGPFHNNPSDGLASPWHWRYVKNYPSGKEYIQKDYGLMKDFELLNSR